jgi:hypothetical protein
MAAEIKIYLGFGHADQEPQVTQIGTLTGETKMEDSSVSVAFDFGRDLPALLRSVAFEIESGEVRGSRIPFA